MVNVTVCCMNYQVKQAAVNILWSFDFFYCYRQPLVSIHFSRVNLEPEVCNPSQFT